MAHRFSVGHFGLYGTPFADISEGRFSFVGPFTVKSVNACRVLPILEKMFVSTFAINEREYTPPLR